MFSTPANNWKKMHPPTKPIKSAAMRELKLNLGRRPLKRELMTRDVGSLTIEGD